MLSFFLFSFCLLGFSSHKNRSERTRKQGEASIHLAKVDAHTPCRTGRLLDRSLGQKRAGDSSLDRTECKYYISASIVDAK